jgi:hypothetical protein
MEMTGAMESQHQAFHISLEISQKTRDSHIPTAPATGLFYWKRKKTQKEKPNRLHKNLDTAPMSNGDVSTMILISAVAFSSYLLPIDRATIIEHNLRCVLGPIRSFHLGQNLVSVLGLLPGCSAQFCFFVLHRGRV